MKKILVLGAGLMGVTIAKDLADEFNVTIIDKSNTSLAKVNDDRIGCLNIDFFSTNKSFKEQFDIIVGALPGHLGHAAAEIVLDSGKDYVDISFAPEDLRNLKDLAWAHNARCLIDFGVAPGLSHLVFGHFKETLKKVNEYHIYVGGLLRYPGDHPPWYYKAPFSPADVIEEYTRPARFLLNGTIQTLPALSMPESLFLECGEVEAFLTDGVRTLLTADADTIIEKTVRPLGYKNKIQILIDSGFFSEEPISIAGAQVRPREVTKKILIDSWKIREGDQDMTVMRLDVKGTDYVDRTVKRSYNLLDYHDGVNSSMARTTGFMCTAGVRLLANNLWTKAGVFAPEEIGEDRGCFEFVLNDLKRHNIKLT